MRNFAEELVQSCRLKRNSAPSRNAFSFIAEPYLQKGQVVEQASGAVRCRGCKNKTAYFLRKSMNGKRQVVRVLRFEQTIAGNAGRCVDEFPFNEAEMLALGQQQQPDGVGITEKEDVEEDMCEYAQERGSEVLCELEGMFAFLTCVACQCQIDLRYQATKLKRDDFFHWHILSH